MWGTLRPIFGVVLELLAAVVALFLVVEHNPGYPILIVALIVVQFLLTFLLHCPAHYVVGRALGISFAGMRLGRTSLFQGPTSFSRRIASLLIVFTLKADKDSIRRASPRRVKAMFLSGVVTSTGSAFIFAFIVALQADAATLATSLFALVYLLFNLEFSPRSGDVMRARSLAKRFTGP